MIYRGQVDQTDHRAVTTLVALRRVLLKKAPVGRGALDIQRILLWIEQSLDLSKNTMQEREKGEDAATTVEIDANSVGGPEPQPIHYIEISNRRLLI